MPIELTIDSIVTDPIKLVAGEKYLMTVILNNVYCVRLIGMHFETNKCFLLPDTMNGIKALIKLYKNVPSAKLLIVGHTDTAGEDDYNLTLSLERADAVKSYLRDEVADWEKWFSDSKPEKKKWGIREIQYMLKALPDGGSDPFYIENPNGSDDIYMRDAVSRFQTWSNENRVTSLKVDGKAGPLTRREIIVAYMNIDGTTLPQGITPVTHGCGEFFPDEPSADNVANDKNRRVECFIFKNEITPPPPGKMSKRGSTEYPQWREGVEKYIDFSKGGIDVLAVDDSGNPISGALVELSGTLSVSAKSDSDGRAHFINLPDGPYTIKTSFPGYTESYKDVTIPYKETGASS